MIEELRSESEDKTAIQQERTLLKTAVVLHRQTALRLQDEVHVRHQDCVAHSFVLLAALLHHHPKFVFLVRYSVYSRVCILSTHIPSSAVITSDNLADTYHRHHNFGGLCFRHNTCSDTFETLSLESISP